ncbi:MAG: hypothetical protein GY814_13475 [Gammaproteobacteria bacterium]|nr:hypothetical protein [Gammaproteobacteria bacterium]
MPTLPYFLETEDAIAALDDREEKTDALLAHIVATLSKTAKNREIRHLTGLKHDYQVSHFKRAGKTLTQEQKALPTKHEHQQQVGLVY